MKAVYKVNRVTRNVFGKQTDVYQVIGQDGRKIKASTFSKAIREEAFNTNQAIGHFDDGGFKLVDMSLFDKEIQPEVVEPEVIEVPTEHAEVLNFIHSSYSLKPKGLVMNELKWKYLVRSAVRGKNIMMTGQAGCGKTMAAKSIEADKSWEAKNGFLRAWVAHIYHMKTAAMPFKNLHESGWIPSEEMKNPELYPLNKINLKPEGLITQEGTRRNIRTIIEYLEGWFNGRGAKGIDSLEGLEGKRPALMEDLATARISIGQTCQRVLHKSVSKDTNRIHDSKLVKNIFSSELKDILKYRPEKSYNYERAVKLGIDWFENYLNLDFKPLAYYDRRKY